MYLLNKPQLAIKTLDKFLDKNNLTVNEDLYLRLTHLLVGCVEGKYKFQTLAKYWLKVIIDRNIEGDLQGFYIKLVSFGKGVTKEKYIYAFGETEGNSRWESYCSKQAISNTFEYKKEKYGTTEEEFRDYNLSRGVTLENMVMKYGELEGNKFFNEYCTKQSYAGCKLEYFVEKYGCETGLIEYNRINSLKAITLENMIRVHGEEEGSKKYWAWFNSPNKKNNKHYSDISQKLFKEIEDSLAFNVNSKYAEKNKEFKFITENSKLYFYDYVIEDLKFCIEFNGDIYHANPQYYSADCIINFPRRNKGKTVQQIWDYDAAKIKSLQDAGYYVIIVWESDYKKDKLSTITKCTDKINELYYRKMQS